VSPTLEYLLKREWSMGNGQCPNCCGVPEGWLGHPCIADRNRSGIKATAAGLGSPG